MSEEQNDEILFIPAAPQSNRTNIKRITNEDSSIVPVISPTVSIQPVFTVVLDTPENIEIRFSVENQEVIINRIELE